MSATQILILKRGKCSWGKCFFCGYGRLVGLHPFEQSITQELVEFCDHLLEETKEVKIFGSGSFLDEKQIPEASRKKFLICLKEKRNISVVVESRSEHVSKEKLKEFNGLEYTIALGLEVADNKILEKLCKGSTVEDFERAAKIIHKHNGKVRAYLIVNPPFAEDVKKSLENSVGYAKKHADSIVLINLLPHGNTPLFNMWLSGCRLGFFSFIV